MNRLDTYEDPQHNTPGHLRCTERNLLLCLSCASAGSMNKPMFGNTLQPIQLLRHHFGYAGRSPEYPASQPPAAVAAAATATNNNSSSNNGSSGSSSSSSTGSSGSSSTSSNTTSPSIISIRLTGNDTFEDVDMLLPATAASVPGMDNLLSAVQATDLMGVTAIGKVTNATQLLSTAGLEKATSTASGSTASSQHMPASDSTSSSSSCSCFRVDAEQLQKQCSVKGWNWPSKNEELVTRCIDFLAHNATQYMPLQQHDPTKNISCTRQLQMHTFWSGPMTWKLKAVIQSFLFTHYTNNTSCRPKPVLNVWLQTVDPNR